MCGGVDPRPLLRTWAGVAVCLAMLAYLIFGRS
jgi:hypothetical protein